ncbi:MAG: RNA polymerase subunit sigma-70 [Desulfofustis sp.]|nr:RNA polymerase subunit sigma-70 [Desulfofustis sp.]
MSSERRGPLSHNVRRLAHLNIPGGEQVEVKGNYACIGHIAPPHGTSIIDVSDPKNPRLVSKIDLPGMDSHSHKVRVVGDDLMIVNSERHRRHFFRKGKRIEEIGSGLEKVLGRPASAEEIARELDVAPKDIPLLAEADKRGYHDGGFKIYDIADRTRPREIAFQKTAGYGVHRFDVDEHYAYISTEMDGFNGPILVIYDISNPLKPEEVSRWWIPGQKIAEGEKPLWINHRVRLHHAMRFQNQLWAACCGAGFRVVDVSDISAPETIGGYDYHPPVPDTTHTALRVPFKVNGLDIAIVIDEQHEHHKGQPHAFMWVFDVSDISNMKPLSTYHVSEADSPWSRVPGGIFGAHQFQEHMESTLVYAAWFSGGLRIVDIANPLLPEERGFFIPEPAKGAVVPLSNDVDVDARGLIYLLDRVNGLDILEYGG